MLTFHRSQTPSCFYPDRAVLSLPASRLHFCRLHSTSPLVLSEHCLSSRDSIHMGGGKETNIGKKPKPTTRETAAVWFCSDTSSILQKSERAWIRASCPRRMDFITWPCHSWQGKDIAHAPGKRKFAWLPLPLALSIERMPVAFGNTLKGPVQPRRVNHIPGCFISVFLSPCFVPIFPLAVGVERFFWHLDCVDCMKITGRKEKDPMKDYSQTYDKNLSFLLKSVFHSLVRNQYPEHF